MGATDPTVDGMCPMHLVSKEMHSDYMMQIVIRSACFRKCGVLTNRTRIRTVLVAPRHGGKKCPKIVEMSECDGEARAACLQSPHQDTENKLQVGRWRECRAPGHRRRIAAPSDVEAAERRRLSDKPAVGYQVRTVECRNSYGTTVELR